MDVALRILQTHSCKYFLDLFFSGIAAKLIIIRWIRNGSKPFWKVIYRIILESVFWEYFNKNHNINTSGVKTESSAPSGDKQNWIYSYNFSFGYPRKAVYSTMR